MQLLPNNGSACEPAACDLRFYAAPVPSDIDAIDWRFAWLTGPGSGSTDNFHFSSDRQRLRVALVTETDHPVLELLFLGDERTAVVHRGGTRVFEGHPDAAGVTITLVPQDGDSWTAILVAARDGTNGRPLFPGLGTIRTIVAPERSRLIVSVRFTEDEAYRADVSNVSLSLMEMNI